MQDQTDDYDGAFIKTLFFAIYKIDYTVYALQNVRSRQTHYNTNMSTRIQRNKYLYFLT